MLTERPVLVLNQNYEPLDVCRIRRAVLLVYRGKLAAGDRWVVTAGLPFASRQATNMVRVDVVR